MSENLDLSGFTTLRLGGPAALVAECPTTEVLVEVVRVLDTAHIPTLILAGGSNLVVGDSGFDGVVVRVSNTTVALDSDIVTVDAGAMWDEVVAETVAAELGGLECLSGIPGSAGATPVQNVGAYGVEIGSMLSRVRLLDRLTGEVRWVEKSELGLGYRTSVLKHSSDALVLAVELALHRDGLGNPIRYRELASALAVDEGERVPSAQVREAVLDLRRSKGMVLDPEDHDTWSAGSFFTNPVVSEESLPAVLAAIESHLGDVTVPRYPAEGGSKLSAGWLIEQAGFSKGHPSADAGARLSTKHTLAVTNTGSATTEGLLDLARSVRDGVESAFGVRLEPEPVMVNCSL